MGRPTGSPQRPCGEVDVDFACDMLSFDERIAERRALASNLVLLRHLEPHQQI